MGLDIAAIVVSIVSFLFTSGIGYKSYKLQQRQDNTQDTLALMSHTPKLDFRVELGVDKLSVYLVNRGETTVLSSIEMVRIQTNQGHFIYSDDDNQKLDLKSGKNILLWLQKRLVRLENEYRPFLTDSYFAKVDIPYLQGPPGGFIFKDTEYLLFSINTSEFSPKHYKGFFFGPSEVDGANCQTAQSFNEDIVKKFGLKICCEVLTRGPQYLEHQKKEYLLPFWGDPVDLGKRNAHIHRRVFDNELLPRFQSLNEALMQDNLPRLLASLRLRFAFGKRGKKEEKATCCEISLNNFTTIPIRLTNIQIIRENTVVDDLTDALVENAIQRTFDTVKERMNRAQQTRELNDSEQQYFDNLRRFYNVNEYRNYILAPGSFQDFPSSPTIGLEFNIATLLPDQQRALLWRSLYDKLPFLEVDVADVVKVCLENADIKGFYVVGTGRHPVVANKHSSFQFVIDRSNGNENSQEIPLPQFELKYDQVNVLHEVVVDRTRSEQNLEVNEVQVFGKSFVTFGDAVIHIALTRSSNYYIDATDYKNRRHDREVFRNNLEHHPIIGSDDRISDKTSGPERQVTLYPEVSNRIWYYPSCNFLGIEIFFDSCLSPSEGMENNIKLSANLTEDVRLEFDLIDGAVARRFILRT